jgi:hypothetical protein
MIDPADANRRLQLYAKQRNVTILASLGHGQDGSVWENDRNSAIKVLYREDSYFNELICYERLQERNIKTVRGCSVPKVVDFDDDLQVFEMTIVAPPYVLDFGKCKVDYRHDHTEDAMAWLEEKITDCWEEDEAVVVRSIVRVLAAYGIYYPDPNRGNINLKDWSPPVQ